MYKRQAHAIVATGSEKGSWEYHGNTYDTRITTYDSNFGALDSKAEDSYIYFNSKTYEWEIPNYHTVAVSKFPFVKGAMSSDGEGYFRFITEDTSILNIHDIAIDRAEYEAWVNYHTNSKFYVNIEGETYLIDGANTAVADVLSTYYDVGYNVETQEIPNLNILFKELSDYTITPSEDEELNASILYPDYYMSAAADSYKQLEMKYSGLISASGLSGQFSIVITANDEQCTLPWYTIEILGNDTQEISAEWTDAGVLVAGDNLENVTIVGSNDDDTQEKTFSTDEDRVLISESNNELTFLIDTNNDGIYDTDVNDDHIHEYGTPEFIWPGDYEACTAVFTCESCDDEQKMECDITSEITDPTCTEDGKTVYTATASFAGKEYTDTQEDVIPATGHTYEYTDNGDGTHTKVCTAGDDTATEPHTYQDGTCTYCGAEEPKEHVHEYGTPEFKWSEDYTTCTAVFTCTAGDDEQRIECQVSSETAEPTCTAAGKTTYTTSAAFEGNTYTDTREKEIPATGHTYSYTDNGDGTHTKACTAGDDTVSEPHTYQDGICTYCGAEEPKQPEEPVQLPYSDVHEGDWFYDSVKYVYQESIMTGLNETTFGPAEDLSRAQFAVILYRMEGSHETEYRDQFKDVSSDPGQFYRDAVMWASSEDVGIITGYTEGPLAGCFGPADQITREQMAVMMYRYAQYKGYDVTGGELGSFPDRDKVSAFAQEAMGWANSIGLITGNDDGTLAPQGTASRAVCATIIERFRSKF